MIAIVGLPNGAPGGPWGPRGPWGPWAPQGPIGPHDRPTIGSYSPIGIGGTVRGSAIALFTLVDIVQSALGSYLASPPFPHAFFKP